MTKTAGMLTDLDKEYESVFRFGVETDTLDTEGEPIAEAPIPDFGSIEKSLSGFRGEISQVPPVFSAIKINGRRAYNSARSGQKVDMPSRLVHIHDFEILSWDAPDLKVRIRCSKGTYIRSIARDLAIAAGSRGYCRELRRTAIGPFSVHEASIPTELDENNGIDIKDFFAIIGTAL